MKNINWILIYVLSLVSTLAIGQNLEAEIGFKYVKAEYLVKTDRMEDAIKELNDIIKSSPEYKDALLLRAETRYRLAAFKGAKEDALKSIEVQGITLGASEILSKAELALGNTNAALNSLTAAVALESKDERIYEMRAEIYEEQDMLLKACEDYEMAAKLGSTNAVIRSKKLCGKKVTIEPPTSNVPTRNDSEIIEAQEDVNTSDETVPTLPTTNPSNNTDNDDDDTNDEVVEDTPQVEEMNIPEENNTPNNIEIDEDLSLSIYGQGLGLRKVLDRPSILILSDVTGVVAVEVCVNENGKVDFAEFNAGKSTISKNSLVSLAIRKSKDFWFEKSDYKKQCGFILFNIKGSE